MDFLAGPDSAPSKREILSHALRLFVREGLCETGIRAIGDAAGYTNPALYKFFASKDALAQHLFERCYLLVYGQVHQALAGGTFEERLTRLVAAWVALMEHHLDAVLFMNEQLRDFWPKVSPAVKRQSLLKALAALVRDGKDEGVVSSALDPELAVALLVGTLGQVARQRFFGGFPDTPTLQAQLTATLFAALTRSTP
jgi:AcrR family transcriptional regulator